MVAEGQGGRSACNLIWIGFEHAMARWVRKGAKTVMHIEAVARVAKP